MKRNMVVVIVALVAFVMMFSSSAAFAGSTDLWSNVSLPGFYFGYGTDTSAGKTNFDASMQNADRLNYASVYVSRDSQDPTHGTVTANFSGIVGDKPGQMEYQGQSTDINRRGMEYSSNASLGSYQEITSWSGDKGGTPIYGDWLSTGSVSATLFDVTPTWANMNYNEYTYADQYGKDVTYFNGNVQWQVNFGSSAAAGFYGAMAPTTVPEPATMCLLGLGGIALIRRRR